MSMVETLIDKWREKGSQRELAKELGVTEQRLSAWKHGTVPMPEHQFARLAELVEGEEKARSLLWDFVQQKQRQLKAATAAAFMALITALAGLMAPDQVVAAELGIHEDTAFTRQGSQVRTLCRPPRSSGFPGDSAH